MSDAAVIQPFAHPLSGDARVPGDKSISHRAVLFAAMAEGTSHLEGVLDSEDVRSSMKVVSQLGAQVNLEKGPDGSLSGTVTGWGAAGPVQPDGPLDCGNSGTTARLLMGMLAPWEVEAVITGDESLCRRPMRRNTAPLMKMGVQFEPAEADHLPITEIGTPNLRAITYDAPMASAQLKTAVLLAGVRAQGTTTLNEPAPSRNHTELMLPEFGVPTTAGTRVATVTGPVLMHASDITVPGDPSSAAFLCVAAILMRGSSICVQDVSLNPARTGFVRTLERMGAKIEDARKGAEGKEPYGSICASYSPSLHGCEVPAQHFASIVDEVPILAIVAAHAKGVTVFKGAGELRVKETDRLQAIMDGLETIGVDAWEEGDNLYIEGDPGLTVPSDAEFDSRGDHRLAMTWAVLGMCAGVPVKIRGFESIAISFPGFLDALRALEA